MPALHRRKFFQNLVMASAATGMAGKLSATGSSFSAPAGEANRFKISLNAYSFNSPLQAGKTNLAELIRFCARVGFDAIDMTGYYFPGYPELPSNEYIFQLKKLAHQQGIGISGTGIRNEFADPDTGKRDAEIRLVKKWIEVAARLGAPVIRIFSGKAQPAGYSREETEKWIVDAIQNCAAYGQQMGVIVAMQNHNDFVQTAEQAISIIQKVNSDWFGLVLDTGSFVTNEPYAEIAKTTGYAVNWQIKERLHYHGQVNDMDLEKLCRIIHASTYRGYLPIETLSPGDPFTIVPPFLDKVKKALAQTAP